MNSSLIKKNGLFSTQPISQASIPDGYIDLSRYAGISEDIGKGIWSNNSCILTCGATNSTGAGNFDLLLVKWYINGTQEWNKTWGTNSQDIGFDVFSDGTFIYAVGTMHNFTISPYRSDDDLVLIKYNGAGTQIWNKTWGSTGNEAGHGIWGDGSALYVVGNKITQGSNDVDLVLIKYDLNGIVMWSSVWDHSALDEGWMVMGDGTNIYTVGETKITDSSSSTSGLLIKWNSSGNEIWNKTWSNNGNCLGYGLWVNESSIYASGSLNDKAWISRWNGSGDLEWDHEWGSVSLSGCTFNSIWSSGGSVFTFGDCFSTTSLNLDIIMVKWDGMGREIWNRTWNGGENDDGYSITGNSNYLYTCGTSRNIAQDMILQKWNSTGSPPVVNFTIVNSTVIEGQSVHFLYTGAEHVILKNFTWNFGDGPVNDTSRNPYHQFSSSNSFQISLTVTDLEDNVRVLKRYESITLISDILPRASFSCDRTEIVYRSWITCTFNGELGNSPNRFEWNFGEGSSNSTEQNPTHQYMSPGLYTIILTVIDADGDISVYSEEILVQGETLFGLPYEIAVFLILICGILIMGCIVIVFVNKGKKKKLKRMKPKSFEDNYDAGK